MDIQLSNIYIMDTKKYAHLYDYLQGIFLTPEYMEFLSSMQQSRIPQHCIMDFVSEMHGGPENVPITAKDIANL